MTAASGCQLWKRRKGPRQTSIMSVMPALDAHPSCYVLQKRSRRTGMCSNSSADALGCTSSGCAASLRRSSSRRRRKKDLYQLMYGRILQSTSSCWIHGSCIMRDHLKPLCCCSVGTRPLPVSCLRVRHPPPCNSAKCWAMISNHALGASMR